MGHEPRNSNKTPFDFILAYRGEWFFSTPKRQSRAVSCTLKSRLTNWIRSLLWMPGHRAGYLIWFRETDQISFVKASALKALKPRCSLKAEDGLIIGSRIDFDMRTIINAIRPKAKSSSDFRCVFSTKWAGLPSLRSRSTWHHNSTPCRQNY